MFVLSKESRREGAYSLDEGWRLVGTMMLVHKNTTCVASHGSHAYLLPNVVSFGFDRVIDRQ